MNRIAKLLLGAVLILVLTGCVHTVDEMYCLPKRSEKYSSLQNAIDGVMGGLEYSAPLSGENQQTVQNADLDGDGVMEYLVFAKGSGERPLQILIFRQEASEFHHIQTIQSSGSAFVQVEYVEMDGKPGVELVVGRQVSDAVPRSVSVYSFTGEEAEQLTAVNYTRFVVCDLDSDGQGELVVFQPSEGDAGEGVVECYCFPDGVAERLTEASMSDQVDRLKRIIVGNLSGGRQAVYASSVVGENTIFTDVYAIRGDRFVNVSLSNKSGASVQSLGNYYVYADDIDDDGTVELPSLEEMQMPPGKSREHPQFLIRWFAMRVDGSEVSKIFTYHNFADGWYLQLDSAIARQFAVVPEADAGGISGYAFYLWDPQFQTAEKIMTIYALSGTDREAIAVANNRFVLCRSDNTIYAAKLEGASAAYQITGETLTKAFHLIRTDWKTGET